PDPLLDGRVIAQEITAQPSQIEVTNALNSVLQITEGDSFPAFTPEAFQELQTTSNGWALKSLDYVYNSGVDRNFSVTLHDGKTLVFDTTNTSDNPADAIIANTEFSPAGVEPNDIRNELSALYPTASPQEIEQLFVETTMKLTEQIETVEVQKQIIQQAVSSPSLANNGTEQIVIASTDIGAPANIIIVPELIPGTTTTQFTVFSANDPTTSQTIYSDIDTLVENMPSDFGITANRMEDLTNSFVQGVQARPGSTFSPQPVNGAGIISTTPIDATVPIAQAVAQNLATTNRTLRMPAGQAPPGGSGLAFPSFAIPPGSISPGVGNNFLNNVEQTVQNIAQQAGPFVSNYGGQAVDAFGNVLGEGIELGQNIRQGVETQGLLPPVFRAAGDFFDEALDTVFGPWWANTKGFFRNIRDSVRNAF
ncbi:hypothetical protein KC717_06455, partial [Candidatus Dojkabacteria bacterium]|nr:hypothetical protein [Candidatus Dojkabacteria bacterium]